MPDTEDYILYESIYMNFQKKAMVMESRSMVVRGWERVWITKGHVETVWGGKNILPFCRKHLRIDEKVKNTLLNVKKLTLYKLFPV